MFQVGRYDPGQDERDRKAKEKKEKEQHSGKKRKLSGKQKKAEGPKTGSKKTTTSKPDKTLNDTANDGKKSSLYVIAPEEKDESKQKSKLAGMPDEAFDDLEIIDDLLETAATAEANEVPSSENETADLPSEIRTALHMSSLPIKEAAKIWELAPFLVENLLKDGYQTFFPIQSLVIPDVIASERHSHIRVRDVCVAAPTGSGKTLAFVIPILNSLANRQIKRLRALVVLPSRDLALQVFEVFDRYTKGSDLKVGIAIGQSDFAAEQRALTIGPADQGHSMDPDHVQLRALLDPSNVQFTLDAFSATRNGQDSFQLPRGGISAVDVLVCTPGRLVDHLDNTPGFTLQHLRFLVIDEADRLLSQSYHNWIGRVISSSNSASVAAWHEMTSEENKRKSQEDGATSPKEWRPSSIDPITWRRGGVGGDDSSFNNNDAYASIVASVCQPVQLRKLLYSATLTRDPQKLTALGLVNPKHYDAHSLSSSGTVGKAVRYSIPASLSEYTIECTAEQKPLMLLGLLFERAREETRRNGLVVVFTSSLDSTHRLARLLQLLWGTAGFGTPEAVAEYSSSLKQHQRTELVAKCNDPNSGISIVVCSDSMSRGMDIESVRTVINYDVPSFAKTYVHRCGRTARAGREGTAISLVKGGQAKNFGRIRALIDNPERVLPMSVDKEIIRPTIRAYKSSIQALRGVLAAEAEGDLDPMDPIPADLFPTLE